MNIDSPVLTLVLCGLAGLALAAPAGAKDIVVNSGGPVDLTVNVSAVREVPAGNPLPGLHLDAKVKGRMLDFYIAPMDFVAKYGIKIRKGEDLRIAGTQVKIGDADVVLTREFTAGSFDKQNGIFHEGMTIYLRNDDGPFWAEEPSR